MCLERSRQKQRSAFPLSSADQHHPNPPHGRARLPEDAYRVLREEGTEPPWSSPLNKIDGPGVFVCAACDTMLFRSDEKFESGSGWPSFWAPASDAAVSKRVDFRAIVPRTEIRCAGCDGHLGHAFSDGPRPTGMRYCMNGVALRYVAADEDASLAEAAAASFAASAEAKGPPLRAVLPDLVMSGSLLAGELLSFAARSGPAAGSTWAKGALQSGLLPPIGPAGAVLLAVSGAAFARSVGLLLQKAEGPAPPSDE